MYTLYMESDLSGEKYIRNLKNLHVCMLHLSATDSAHLKAVEIFSELDGSICGNRKYELVWSYNGVLPHYENGQLVYKSIDWFVAQGAKLMEIQHTL